MKDKMLNFTEVLSIIGITASHPNAPKLRDDMPKYENPYSKTKIYKASDLDNLLLSFDKKSA